MKGSKPALAVLMGGMSSDEDDSPEAMAKELREAIEEKDDERIASAMDAYCADWMERMKSKMKNSKDDSESGEY